MPTIYDITEVFFEDNACIDDLDLDAMDTCAFEEDM